MTTQVAPSPIFRGVDNNGNALSGGKLFVYAAGTATKITSYTDSTGSTPNTNPVILNSRGEANVWFAKRTYYKLVLCPSTDTDPPTNPFWTENNLWGGESNALSDMGNVSGNVAIDLSSANEFKMQATGNITLSNPQNYQTGDNIQIEITQDSTGSRLLTVGGAWSLPPGSLLSTTPGAVDIVFGTIHADGTVQGRISPWISPYGSAAIKNTGSSVGDPGTGNLEWLQKTDSAATTGNSYVFLASDLQRAKRRSNSGTAMGDTLMASGSSGLTDGALITICNRDSAAILTLTAGAGTTIETASTLAIGAGYNVVLGYNLAQTDWRVIWTGLGIPPAVTTFTPTIDAGTPGDFAVTYSSQVGFYYKIGRLVFVYASVVTATFTFTTASGTVGISGCPVIPATAAQALQVLQFSNAAASNTWPGTSGMVYGSIALSTGRITFNGIKAGQASPNTATMTNLPTGSNVTATVQGMFIS